jgi:hypothetical protein
MGEGEGEGEASKFRIVVKKIRSSKCLVSVSAQSHLLNTYPNPNPHSSPNLELKSNPSSNPGGHSP